MVTMTPSMIRSMAEKARKRGDTLEAEILEEHAVNQGRLLDRDRRLDTAEALLARAHGMLEGRSRKLVFEIAAFLGWEVDAMVLPSTDGGDR